MTMRGYTRRTAALVLALCLLLAACADRKEQQTDFQVGEKVSTYWFDFTVDQVETADRYETYVPAEGNRLVVCGVTLKSTFKEPVPMNWADFVLLWEDPEGGFSSQSEPAGMDGVYPLPALSQEQLPDEYEIEKGKTLTGDLVFEVPAQVTRASLVFQELFAEGESENEYSEGEAFQVLIDL